MPESSTSSSTGPYRVTKVADGKNTKAVYTEKEKSKASHKSPSDAMKALSGNASDGMNSAIEKSNEETYRKSISSGSSETTNSNSPGTQLQPKENDTDSSYGNSDGRLARTHFSKEKGIFISRPYAEEAIENTTSGIDNASDDPNGINGNDTLAGVPSLMNFYSFSTFHGTDGDRKLLYDKQGKRKWYDKTKEVNGYKNPSVDNLISFFGNEDNFKNDEIDAAMPYSYSDFAYCKWFGKIPNNRLVTLRRYTVPVLDNLRMPDWAEKAEGKNPARELAHNKFYPIAQAVTWLGKECENDISAILNFKVSLPWEDKESTAEVVESDTTSASNTAGSGKMANAFKAISILSGEANLGAAKDDFRQYRDPYNGGPYSNRVLGPVNCIKSTKKRAQGLNFDHNITLTFKYTSRSIGGVNGKAALLDIMSNFLVMCYGVGSFWGGMNRWDGRIIAFPWKEGMRAWYAGDPVALIRATAHSLSKAQDKIASLLDSIKADPMNALANIAGDALQAGAGALFNTLGRQPQQAPQIRALLTGDPVGEWHLVVGNPLAPMMMIGNLVCDGCEFEWGNELGPDDFPLDLTVKVSLKHGMPRDRHMVESMFNQGYGRIYTIPTNIENTSGANESKIDRNTGKLSRGKSGTLKDRYKLKGAAYIGELKGAYDELRHVQDYGWIPLQPKAAEAKSAILGQLFSDGTGEEKK